jgi:hypothetical protein
MELYGKGEASLFAHKCKSGRVTHNTFKRIQVLSTHTHYYLSDEPTHGLRSYNSSYQGS